MPEPTKIPRPFADSGDKNSIPDSSGGLGFANWQEGFPAITGTPFAQGGVAPKRADFNGIFNALSAATVWNQQGGVYAYDNTTDYEVGNVVEYSGDLYKCLVANGPNSAVKAPTDTTVWSKVMTSADTAALYFQLSGGTLTGDIQFNKSTPAISAVSDDTYVRVTNADFDGGASLYLSGKNRALYTGQFVLYAYNGTNRKAFVGDPNGALTWDGKSVCTLGGKVQTGTAGTVSVNAGASATFNVTFPIPYSSSPHVYLVMISGSTSWRYGYISAWITSLSTTGFVGCVGNGDTTEGRAPTIWWLAIGD